LQCGEEEMLNFYYIDQMEEQDNLIMLYEHEPKFVVKRNQPIFKKIEEFELQLDKEE
jgi:uncharacterized protein YlzI (FlbEa/FlbD family)